MAELSYRPWEDGDDLTLLEIWGDADSAPAGQFRAALTPATDANPWRRTIVAEDQGIPVAAGVVYSTKLHPARLWVFVEVAKDHRRAGVGATLLTMLRGEAAGALAAGLVSTTALRTKVAPGTSGAAFAEAMGLGVLQRNRIVEVGPGALKLPMFGEGTEEEAEARVQDLATGSVELTDVVGRYYESVNQSGPELAEPGPSPAHVLGRPHGRPRCPGSCVPSRLAPLVPALLRVKRARSRPSR
ncbi:GNAT family N-acetyltransferase [Arthrobacter psychrolactophilus]